MIDLRRITRAAVTVSLGTRGRTDARRSEQAATRRSGRRSPVDSKQRPVVLILLGLVFMTGSAAALFANGGHVDRRRLEAREREASRELDRQLRRVNLLRRDVNSLSDDSLARERLAREELGYSRDGEVIFLLAEPSPRP